MARHECSENYKLSQLITNILSELDHPSLFK